MWELWFGDVVVVELVDHFMGKCSVLHPDIFFVGDGDVHLLGPLAGCGGSNCLAISFQAAESGELWTITYTLWLLCCLYFLLLAGQW